MSHYLVTGGAGFIGSHLAEELTRRGHAVRVADSLITGRRGNLDHVSGVEFLEGDLADLPFDGQTAITQRPPARGHGCTFIGNRRFQPNPPESDPARLRRYAGPKRQFLAIAPWVRNRGSREKLRQTSAQLAPGSHSKLENDYLETALIADLPFPPDRSRPGCAR